MRFLLSLFALLLATSAAAEDPKFEFTKPEEVKEVESTVQTRVGFILSTGNSRSTSLAAGVTASRKANQNRFSGEAAGAFVRSGVLFAVDQNGSGFIDEEEIQRVTQTTSQSWSLSARYDRFFAESNSVFVSARAASDVPAGKELLGGGQVGYARRLYKTASSETTLEAGYDFQYEKYVTTDAAGAIHSARLAASHSTKLGEANVFTLEAEALTNLNEETLPNPDGTPTVPPLRDFRTNVAARLNLSVTERVGFGFTFKLRYDNVPAPRPPFAVPYAEGVLPFADRLDTSTEASLIVTLL